MLGDSVVSFIFSNTCGERCEDMIALIIAVKHTTEAVVKLKPEINSDLNGIRTHDLYDTGAVLYRLSS